MLVSLTVGKVDAGVAVLLTQDNRLVSSPPPPPFCSWRRTVYLDAFYHLPIYY